MYGYRRSLENGFMINLNSISSSFSSIDTVGQRDSSLGKSSVDYLIGQHKLVSALASALYRSSSEDERYSVTTGARNAGARHRASNIYFGGRGHARTCCPQQISELP